jgi:hypothetical protein
MPTLPHCSHIFLKVFSLNVQIAYASLSVSSKDTNMMSHNQTGTHRNYTSLQFIKYLLNQEMFQINVQDCNVFQI